jgi:sugar/nucleoside kinase (ribokinase family)
VLLLDDEDLDRAIQVAGWARAAGAAVVLDVDMARPEIAALVARADIVIVSDGFPQRLTGKAALRPALHALARYGPTLVVATLGAGGALACHDGQLTFVPAHAVPAVDTTSAGDVFHAGVIHGVLQHWSLQDTLRFASVAAALTCTALGGRAAIPPLTALTAW